MKKQIIIALAAVALLSCSKESSEPQQSVEQKVEALFSKATITRSIENSWLKDDTIGISMVEQSTIAISDSKANIPYLANQSGATTAFSAQNSVIYLPQDGSTVDFYAYHPYQSTMTGSGDYSVDLSVDSNAKSDLLRAVVTSKSKSDSAVELNFSHRLSFLTINFTLGSGVESSEVKAKILGIKTTANYNIFSDSFDNIPTAEDCLLEISDSTASLMVLPQSLASDTEVVFTVGNDEYIWKMDKIELEKGRNYIYNVTIHKTSITLDGSTITDWIADDSAENGEVFY
ncbi:MAG: fimbrillin family protein [Rikenellaceae bacterium]